MRGDKPTSPAILQRLTDELYRETTPVFIDEPDHFLTFGPGSDAKKLKQPSEVHQRRVAGDVHGVASRFGWPKIFRHGSWDVSRTAGLLKSIDRPCAMKPPALELLPGTRLASTNFPPRCGLPRDTPDGLGILVKFPWHVPDFPIYSNGLFRFRGA